MGDYGNMVKRIRDLMRQDAGISGDAQRIEQTSWMLFLKVYDTKEADWEAVEDDYRSIIPEKLRWRNWAANGASKDALTGNDLLEFVNNELFPSLKKLSIRSDAKPREAIVKTMFAEANQYMKDGVVLRQVLNLIDDIDLADNQELHAFGRIYEEFLQELQSAGSAGEFYTPRPVTDFMAKMVKPKTGEKMADFACGTGGFLTSYLKELQRKKIATLEDRKSYNSAIYGIEKKQFPYMLCVTNMLLHDVDDPQVFHDNSLEKDVLNYVEDDRFDVILMNPPYGGSENANIKQHFPADIRSSETADLFMAVIMYRLKAKGRAAVVLPDGFLFGADNAKLALKAKLLKEFNLHTIVRLPSSVFAPYTSITTNLLFFDKTGPTKAVWYYRLDMPEGIKHFSKTKPMELAHFAPVEAWWKDRKEIEVDGAPKAKKFTAEELAANNYNFDLCGFPHEVEEILPPHELIAKYQAARQAKNDKIDQLLSKLEASLDGAGE